MELFGKPASDQPQGRLGMASERPGSGIGAAPWGTREPWAMGPRESFPKVPAAWGLGNTGAKVQAQGPGKGGQDYFDRCKIDAAMCCVCILASSKKSVALSSVSPRPCCAIHTPPRCCKESAVGRTQKIYKIAWKVGDMSAGLQQRNGKGGNAHSDLGLQC